ncbi:MAG: hypothetical protein K2O52_02565, partial [Oscillospiraceae bacterium]|nr:hypothetical protein [Oscillospiraceae bacterium]
MNEIQIFNHEEFGEVRTVEIDGQVYFVGVDVARALHYKDPSKALRQHVDKEDKKLLSLEFCKKFLIGRFSLLEKFPNRGLNVVNESGLYSLVLASKLPSSKKFKHWVTSEVLPAIRKTGAYNPNPQQIETTQPIQQIEVHIDHVENLHITQKKEVFSMKNSNTQGVKRVHVYKDKDGIVLAEKHITKQSDGEKRCCWYAIDPKTGRKTTGLNGMKMPLYHSEKLHTNQSPFVWFAEGEKDVETLETYFELTATCTSSGGRQTGWNNELYNEDLHGRTIIILTDNDATGEAYGEFIAKNVYEIAESVKIVPAKSIWSECPEKGDISDIVQILGKDKTKQLLLDAINKTESYAPKSVKKTVVATKRESKKRKKFTSDYDVDGTGVLTIDNLQAYLKKNGYSVTYDEILHDCTYSGFKGESQEHLKETASDIICDKLQLELKGCNSAKIARLLNVIATRNKVNPIRTMIENTAWDGKDRLEEIYAMFGIEESDTMSRTLFRKWSMQAIAGLYNKYESPFSLDIVLVFQGAQGIAKTRFFEHLAMNHLYFGEGYTIDTRNKDDIIQVTSNWIVELGEIGSTMRKDMDSLKAFLTKSMDEYRAPYGRTSLKYPRKTSFVGTVNDERYLIDETGNRRFATIPIKKGISLNYDTQIVPFDSLQFWAQIHSIVQAEIENGATIAGCFRLTDEEREALETRNLEFTKPLKGEQEVVDILIGAERFKNVEYKYMTVTEFKDMHM